MNSMHIEDCYEDKKPIVDVLMQNVLSILFDDIEADDEYTLGTDENTELCVDIIKMYVEKELK